MDLMKIGKASDLLMESEKAKEALIDVFGQGTVADGRRHQLSLIQELVKFCERDETEITLVEGIISLPYFVLTDTGHEASAQVILCVFVVLYIVMVALYIPVFVWWLVTWVKHLRGKEIEHYQAKIKFITFMSGLVLFLGALVFINLTVGYSPVS